MNGPYRKYVVDSENNAVGRVKSGGPELFLEVVKEVSADGQSSHTLLVLVNPIVNLD